jgi:glycine/D-amino acid oxidase-like deaminating enzyme
METTDTRAYGESWYAATAERVPERAPLTLDLDVDVCVVGGGLAGLTTAREVARRGWSVVVLEARRIASSASGRNTGFVLPGFAAEPDNVIARIGSERARNLWALSEAGLEYVRSAIQDESIHDKAMVSVDPRPGWLYVSKTDNGDDMLHLMRQLGEFGCYIEGWSTEQVRAVLKSERYFHAVHFPQAFHIHPLNYAFGLAGAAERDGARIFERTPALSIDPAGVRKRIVTPSARLRANHVVLCGNVQIGALMQPVAGALLPVTTYVITTTPLGPVLADAVAYTGAVSDTDLADNHYRIVGGDRLMWSGRATTWARDPQHYVLALQADIRDTYPQLGPVSVDYSWSGTLGNPVHRMPQIGELAPGLWLASGFGGHGLNTTAMAGNLIARAIVEGDQTWRQFSPFELIWAGGWLGRATVQVSYWLKRIRDARAERRARHLDGARRCQLRLDAAEETVEPLPEVGETVPEISASEVEPAPEAAKNEESPVAVEAALADVVPADASPEDVASADVAPADVAPADAVPPEAAGDSKPRRPSTPRRKRKSAGPEPDNAVAQETVVQEPVGQEVAVQEAIVQQADGQDGQANVSERRPTRRGGTRKRR